MIMEMEGPFPHNTVSGDVLMSILTPTVSLSRNALSGVGQIPVSFRNSLALGHHVWDQFLKRNYFHLTFSL